MSESPFKPAEYLKFNVKDDLISVKFVKDSNGKDNHLALANYYKSQILDIYKNNPKQKFNILFDLRDVGMKMSNVSMDTSTVYDEVTGNKQTKRVAVIGNSKLEQIVINILFSRLKERKANWFVDKTKALRWLGVKA